MQMLFDGKLQEMQETNHNLALEMRQKESDAEILCKELKEEME